MTLGNYSESKASRAVDHSKREWTIHGRRKNVEKTKRKKGTKRPSKSRKTITKGGRK